MRLTSRKTRLGSSARHSSGVGSARVPWISQAAATTTRMSFSSLSASQLSEMTGWIASNGSSTASNIAAG